MLTFLFYNLLILYMSEDVNFKQLSVGLFVLAWLLMPLILFFVGKSNDWWHNSTGVGWFIIWIYMIIPVAVIAQKFNKLEEENLYNEVTKE